MPHVMPAGRSLTERHRADPIKAGGVHYTPPSLATFIAQQAVTALPASSAVVRVLDPACGDGALLAAAARALPSARRVELCGFDRDSAAVQHAQARLTAVPANCTVTIDAVDFIDAVLDETDAVSSARASRGACRLAGQFDLVIANPPYVRTQVLGTDAARRLAAGFGLRGRVDLYHAFAVAMTTTLRSDGVLALLCSNRFLTTKTGTDLRDVLRRQFEIVSIFDLGDTRAFDAAVLPAVVIARRHAAGSECFPMAAIYKDRAARAATREVTSVFDALTGGAEGAVSVGGAFFDIRRGTVDPRDPRRPWVPATTTDRWVSQVEAAAVMRFGDVAKVRVGVKTTADDVFIRGCWDDQAHVPEAALLRPLLTHHVARRWAADAPVRTILYPYDLESPSRLALDLAQWPAAAAYLDEHRGRLAARTYVRASGRHWWEIWVPQRPSVWAQPKIVCPDISAAPKFFYDTSGAVVNGDCYWMSVDDENLALLMLAIANSSLGGAYYDAVCANRLYAGRRRYITQYVERFPIPDPAQPVVRHIVDTVRALVRGPAPARALALEAEIDRSVRQSFGLEPS
jgi:methylase of polypeptide subunit release factors